MFLKQIYKESIADLFKSRHAMIYLAEFKIIQ